MLSTILQHTVILGIPASCFQDAGLLEAWMTLPSPSFRVSFLTLRGMAGWKLCHLESWDLLQLLERLLGV